MRKIVLAVTLVLMLAATGASANLIGIFADQDATLCAADMNVPYSYVNVYFLALLTDIPAITAAEFGATNVQLAGFTLPTVTWNTTLVIGDIFTPEGVALAFTVPVPGPICVLGNIQYFVLAAPPETLACIVPSGAGILAVVDELFVTRAVDGWCLVFNCIQGGQYGACDCLDSIATEETSWGALKSLY